MENNTIHSLSHVGTFTLETGGCDWFEHAKSEHIRSPKLTEILIKYQNVTT